LVRKRKKKRKNPITENFEFFEQRKASGKPSPLFNGDWEKTENFLRMGKAMRKIVQGFVELISEVREEDEKLKKREQSTIDC
jgi:hypothetical protein